jgi:hypothetical protein
MSSEFEQHMAPYQSQIEIWDKTHESGDSYVKFLRQFNHLSTELYNHAMNYIDNPQREADLKAQIQSILESIPDQKSFLWNSMRLQICDASQKVLSVLESEPVTEFYGVGQPDRTISEFRAMLDKSNFRPTGLIHFVQYMFGPVLIDVYDPDPHGSYNGVFSNYPYTGLPMADNLDITRVCANLGHDIHKLPGFNYLVHGIRNYVNTIDTKQNHLERLKFINSLLPELHTGLVSMFQYYSDLGRNSFEIHDSINLSQICRCFISEAASRAWNDNLLTLKYDDHIYHPAESTKSPQTVFSLVTHIDENLTIPGNPEAIHALGYQLAKNTVQILKESRNPLIENPEIAFTAGSINLNGHPIIALRLTDNGPGFDLTAILKAKQKLIDPADPKLTDIERLAAGDWTQLDLRVVDVINFIFNIRVSGSDRGDEPHSGLGLSMVKDILDRHGATIWVTNSIKNGGAKFLILFDASADGSLRNSMPELFNTDSIPADLLRMIDSNLDDKFKK